MNPLYILTHNIKDTLLDALNDIFVEHWRAGTLLIASWFSSLFGESILMFINPDLAKAWVPIAGTAITLALSILYLYRGNEQKRRHTEEKHIKEMRQDEIEHCRQMWISLIETKRIPETTTLEEFKENTYDRIKQ
jgi:hypothetical protein